MIIGTYRLEEIDDSHSLLQALETIRKHNFAIHNIHLPPLSRRGISDMIKDTIRVPSIEEDFDLKALSEWVYTKTEGNSFFATRVQTLAFEIN